MADGYRWLVFVHIASVLTFFLAHGVAASVALRLRKERDPARVRALLEVSSAGVGATMGLALLVAIASGVWAGFAGDFWGYGWIWASLVLLVVVGGLMTPMGTLPLGRIRAAAGIARGKAADVPVADPVELERLTASYNPIPIAALGITGLLLITWLMMFKPF